MKTVQDALVDAIDVIRTLQREKAELARQHDQTVEFYETQLRIARGGGKAHHGGAESTEKETSSF